MKKLVVIGGGALAVCAMAAVAYLFVLSPKAHAGPIVEATPVHVDGKLGPNIVLQERVFNLADGPTGAPSYLKLATTVEFETTDPGWYKLSSTALAAAETKFDTDDIGSGRQIIEDIVTNIVSNTRASDIATTAGKDKLRQELKDAIAAQIKTPPVYRVLFTDFIVQ